MLSSLESKSLIEALELSQLIERILDFFLYSFYFNEKSLFFKEESKFIFFWKLVCIILCEGDSGLIWGENTFFIFTFLERI